MCHMAIPSKQLCTHHKHALVSLKNTQARKSYATWTWEICCSQNISPLARSECLAYKNASFLITWHHREQTDIKWYKTNILAWYLSFQDFKALFNHKSVSLNPVVTWVRSSAQRRNISKYFHILLREEARFTQTGARIKTKYICSP